MISTKTLFVLGAGASAEFGLPLGTELAGDIRRKLDLRWEAGDRFVGSGDEALWHQVLRASGLDSSRLFSAAQTIRQGISHSNSIDDFLELHRDSPEIVALGKAAIVRTILERERQSRLFVEHPYSQMFEGADLANTWLGKLMRILGRGSSPMT